ncbi:phosphate ABC transporter substrate-binding protein PstS [Leucobacter sp. W1478]|uniref:phosphate ABC transporter substrate-binding protein PstS n=1 Tax=Leucobacter sp. W1478 TaxID=3439065 RepID=UPI003F396B7C
MKQSARLAVAALSVVAMFSLSACAVNEMNLTNGEGNNSSLSGTLIGSGSSAQAAAQVSWVASFQTQNPDVTVAYDPTGSGAGRETFQQGASTFAGSDRAFDLSEIEAGPFRSCAPGSSIIQFPAYISPIALIFNVSDVEALNLDGETIAKIFTGQITQWDDPAIVELNPSADLPSTNITPVHRSDDSGTTDNFTDYLAGAAPEVWTAGAVGTWPSEFGGEGAQGTSGVVEAVTNGVGTIGYTDASRAGDLGTVAVKVGQSFVTYTPEAAAAMVDLSPTGEGRGANDLAIELNRAITAEQVYPIVLVSYLVGCETYSDPSSAELVKAYFTYVTSEEGQQEAASSAGGAPISADLRTRILVAIDAIS